MENPRLTLTADRNTTLHHPDADISPNASISAEDVDASRTVRRSLRSRKRRHRHTISHGKISADSSESLHPTTTVSTGGLDDDALAPMQCVMMPDGRVSNDMSLEEAIASFMSDRGSDEELKKKGLFKRIMGH